MNVCFVIFLIIGGWILATDFFNYLMSLPQRRKNKEIARRQALICEEKCQAERAKQLARVAGETARKNIDRLANSK